MFSASIRFVCIEKTNCCVAKKNYGPGANKSDELTRHKSTLVAIKIRICVRIVENRTPRFVLII